ncbi:MAG: FtsW/RodA/SpoVE family cell cycle protein [Pseudobutyrivibrio sp.]|nr:FtsW/RodA/SpoVE family cell cycle protein [Pseudobutyrivibrio sp.]
MVSVITSFSRITILSFVLAFTIIDLIQIFEFKLSDTLSSILATVQAVMIVLFLINGSIVLYMAKDNDITILVLMLVELVFYWGIYVAVHKMAVPMSRTLLNNILMFLDFSFLMLERIKVQNGIKQLAFGVSALVVAYLVIILIKSIHRVSQHIYFYGAIGIISLLSVIFIGNVEYGARMSFTLLGVRVQPSEFVKLSFVFFIAAAIVTYKDYRGFLISTIGSALHVLVLVLSKDLGSALIFLGAYVFITFIAYKNYILLSIEFAVGLFGGILAYKMFPHIQTRFIAWSDPLSVIDDKGYQISQSLFAIGTPGWFGSGLNNGVPGKIPVVTNDFIFAAIAEEMGTIVAICLILMFMCSVFAIFNIAFSCSNKFYMLVVSGLGIIFAIQSILNIGGVIKFIPSTGVTLPFISSGGSSLLSLMITFFIIDSADELGYCSDVRGIYE